MKRIAKYLHIGMLFSMPLIAADDCGDCSTTACAVSSNCQSPKTVFIPISIGADLSKQYHKINYGDEDKDECEWYFDLDATYSYSRTRKGECMAKSLFGSNVLDFQGNVDANDEAITRRSTALVSEYFGFASDSDFSVNLCPRIQNHKIDLQLAFGGEKAWFQINAPIVYSKFDINKNCAPTAGGAGNLGTLGLQSGGKTGTFGQISKGLTTFTDSVKTGETAPYNATNANTIMKAIANSFDIDGNDSNINILIKSNTNEFDEIGINGWGSLKVDGTVVTGSTQTSIHIIDQTPKASGIINADNIAQASSVDAGLSGMDFGNVTRTNNLFNFKNSSCKSDWKVADLGLQLGYDFYKCDDKHFGLYIKAIIPTGTDIDSKFAKNVFSPVIGNGKHVELGAGLSAHAELWSSDDNAFVVNVDGYMTHLLKKSQFRTFDRSNDPMSRYSIVKQLTKVVSPVPTGLDDVYAYNYVMKPLGDFNNQCSDISIDLKGEAVIDFIYSHNNWELGAGYSFSGQSKEKLAGCKTDCDTDSVSDGKYYGFAAGTSQNDLVFENTAGTDGQKMNVFAKTCGDVVAGGPNLTNSAYSYAATTSTTGTTASDVFTLPDFNRSGLMEGQMLHRVFGHVDYVWSDNSWMPEVGVLGSFGFSPDSYKTAQYWDVGARLGFSY